MARPPKKGLVYFSLDCDFFEDDKTKALRRAYGQDGILTYINLLTRVYANGYYLEYGELSQLALDIAEQITNVQIKKTAARVEEIIHYLVGRGALDEGLFKQGVISGEKIQEQYRLTLKKMKRVCDMQAYVLPQALSHAEKIGVSTEETPIISEETPVISEETRRKEKEKITTTTTISFNKESGKEKNVQNPVPDLFEVRTYFRKLGFSETEAVIEAARFLAYNAARGWEGLLKAEWQALAQLWAERKDERDGI